MGRDSFEEFYDRTRPVIVRALALAIGDLDVATEAVDEAYTRAFARWRTVAVLDRPEAWVYRVASNWAVSIFRRRRLSMHRLYAPDIVEMPEPAERAVHEAVAELDVAHRSVVVCRYLLGWSIAETAAALGLREGTVKSRLHRASAGLRSRLEALDPTAAKESR
jgi:RNA polymerase sigma-70 factor (ECF subfamily)